MLGNQGLLAISFFESTAFIVLSVLFILFRRDHPAELFPPLAERLALL